MSKHAPDSQKDLIYRCASLGIAFSAAAASLLTARISWACFKNGVK